MTSRWLIVALVLMTPSAVRAEEYVVKAAKIYTMTGAPLEPGAVHVKDGKIVAVAKTIAPPAGVKVIDLGSGVIMPGLVDAHTSLGIDGGISETTREVTPNFRVTDGVEWNGRGFRTARAEGTTTVGLVPGTENVIAGLSAVVKTAATDPARRVIRKDNALVITGTSDPANGNSARNRPDSIYARQPTNRMGVIWTLRSEFGKAQNSPTKEIARLRDTLDGKLPVVCVSRLDTDLFAALRLRTEFPMNLTIAGGHEAYKVKEAIAAAKVPVYLGRLTTTGGSGPENTETVLNLAGSLHEAGITIALTGGQLLDQARFAVRHGLPADSALASITSVPAKLLSVDDRVGTIATGRDADLVALTGEPLEITTAIRWTMSDGLLRPEDQ